MPSPRDILKSKSKAFKQGFWWEFKRGLLSMLPKAFFTPMIPLHSAHAHDYKPLHLTENRTLQHFDSDRLRIGSYNIWRNYNAQQINRSLETIMDQVDVLLIQEDVIRHESGMPDRVRASDWNYVYGQMHQVKKKTDYYNFSQTGTTTLSRFAFEKTEVYPLPKAHNTNLSENHLIQRVVVYSKLQKKNGKSIGIYNVHLCNLTRPAGRKRQIEFVLNKVKENNDDYVVIGGDFNTYMGPFEWGLKTLKKARFTNGSKLDLKPFDLDHIFTSNNFKKRIDHPIGSRYEHPGSDHLPADIVEIWL